MLPAHPGVMMIVAHGRGIKRGITQFSRAGCVRDKGAAKVSQ